MNNNNNLEINKELMEYLNKEDNKRKKTGKIIAWKKEKRRGKIEVERIDEMERKVNNEEMNKLKLLQFLGEGEENKKKNVYGEELRRNYYNQIHIEKDIFYMALIFKRLKSKNRSFREIENILKELGCDDNQIREGKILYENVLKFREK